MTDLFIKMKELLVHSSGNYYLLVDQSAFPYLTKIKKKMATLHIINILDTNANQPMDAASPVLIQLDLNGLNEEIIQWFCTQGAYANGLHVLKSSLPLKQLAEKLAERSDALLPDNMTVLLRYFDTRIFASLLTILAKEQIKLLSNDIQSWWYVNRSAELIVACLDNEGRSDPETKPQIVFSAEQEAGLLDAANGDMILSQLQQNPPEIMYSMRPDQQYEVVIHLMRMAVKNGIQQIPEWLAFCVFGFATKGAIYQQAPWTELIDQLKAGKISFAEALELSNED
ncbi:DUF4123 domain-containing protein [Iodobacter arcticus]|uniref:DUF4123 domain-containing protein n=1 Tax=Iodobacter arcticus TaxID=590593 RepID=A0ABW2QTZ7_9NEIS